MTKWKYRNVLSFHIWYLTEEYPSASEIFCRISKRQRISATSTPSKNYFMISFSGLNFAHTVDIKSTQAMASAWSRQMGGWVWHVCTYCVNWLVVSSVNPRWYYILFFTFFRVSVKNLTNVARWSVTIHKVRQAVIVMFEDTFLFIMNVFWTFMDDFAWSHGVTKLRFFLWFFFKI